MDSLDQTTDRLSQASYPRAGYGRALERTGFAVVECSAEGRILRWNEGAARLFGYTAEEAVGRSAAGTLLPGGDAEAWQRLRAAEPGALQTWTGVRKDGSACTCAWSCEPLSDEPGREAALVCLGHEVAAAPAPEGWQGREAVLLRAILDHLQIVVWAVDRGGIFTFQDGKALTDLGGKPGALVGQSVFAVYSSDADVKRMRDALAGVPDESVTPSSGRFWKNWIIPVRDEEQQIESVVAASLDITDLKQLEQEAQARLAVLERQQQVIRELSTPIIEVWEGVLALPMIGVIDSARTAEVMDQLLEAVTRAQARFAILDLTGVEAVDTKTASYLIHLIRAIRLLGAEGIITGIRPTVAQTLVTLGVDLGDINTLGNLRAALRHCIVQLARGASPDRARLRPPAPPPPAPRGGG